MSLEQNHSMFSSLVPTIAVFDKERNTSRKEKKYYTLHDVGIFPKKDKFNSQTRFFFTAESDKFFFFSCVTSCF